MINKVILVGNLGADPELKYTQNNKARTTLSVATTRYWRDANGVSQENTQWHRVIVWGRKAESCREHLTKGRQVYVEGYLQTRRWEDRSGNLRYTTEVVADDIKFLGSSVARGVTEAPTEDNFDSEPPF
jgi:single-strand DNA-binding protein